MKKIITISHENTQETARNFIGEILKRKNKGRAIVIAIEGDLGAGKTTFTQGMAKAIGIKDNITSPTFVLIKKYEVTPPQSSPYVKPALPVIAPQLRRGGEKEGFKNLFHIDCYRIEKPWQLQELGFEEIISNPKNIIVIEWPEKIAEILPDDAIKIKFEFIEENKRKILFNNKIDRN